MKQERDLNFPEADEGMELSRRGLFQRAGLVIAAAALPAGAARAGQSTSASAMAATAAAGRSPSPPVGAQPVSPAMEKLSTYMSEAGNHALPDEVMQKTKQHILDTLAAQVSGSDLVPGREAIRFVTGYGGREVSTVVASDVVCGPIEAALTNAMLSHADETDDSHAPSQSHPGCAVVPAALAAGERFAVDGMTFLRSVTLGYDVGTRVMMAMGAQGYEARTHRSSHSIVTIFGAAAAAGCAAKLNAQQIRWMLDYTAQQCSGLAAWHRDTQHIEKAFVFAGMGARSGITAALVVESGWTGLNDIFSGPDNFFMVFAPHADPAGLIDKLGERYEVTRTNIKKWPVGSPIQAVLDALVIMQKQHPFNAGQVQHVTVRLATDEAAIVNNRVMPDICLQQMVAVMLLNKTVTFRTANDNALMKDPAILRERAKVTLVPDEELQHLLPLRVGIVELTLTGGTHLSQRVDNVRGTPENPMTRDEIETKARDLMTPILGATKTSALIDKVFSIEKVKDVRELRPLLQRA